MRDKYSIGFRYGLAVLAVALATVCRGVFYAYFGGYWPYLFFFPVVIFAAAVLGVGPGFLAVFLSTVSGAYWVGEVSPQSIFSPNQLLAMLVFVLNNCLIVWVFEGLRRASRRVAEADAAREKSELLAQQSAALRESERQFRYILKHSPNAMAVFDRSMRYFMVSDRFLADFRLSEANVIGRSHYEIFPNLPEHWPGVHKRCLAGAVEHGEDEFFIHADGTSDWLRWECRPWYLGDGSVGGVILCTEMITERRRAREDLRRAKEAAEEANRAKDRFLAILSHELRTPLTPVLLAVRDRETDETLEAGVRDDMAMARRNLELEARLIDDLLDLNRLVHGKAELRLLPGGDLHSTLRNVATICRREMEEKGLTLRMELDAQVPRIKADTGRVQQVFWNLLKNAAKFTPPGGVVTMRTSNPRPDLLRAEVLDTGCGINPQVIPRLFVAFEQGEDGGARRKGGLGLGLAICKAVVDMHGGQISAYSEGVGKGAVFTVDLPVCGEGKRREPAESPAKREWRPQIDGRKLSILLVEDHADTLRILSRSLRRAGCAVVTAESVESALAAARKAREEGVKIDLLVSDLGLPDGDGRELMRRLRELDGLTGIAVSGYGMEEDIATSRAAGFAVHLTKPVQIEDIQQAISRLLPDLLHRAQAGV
ncbi:MAG: ATP-binding protein [Chthoniobacteraceae bacterium]|nr:ATP-binding protein [Chthoniobacteraceae bacterium]